MSEPSLELAAEDILSFRRDFHAVKEQIARAVKGCEDLLEQVLVAFFAGGHVLLEGEPGLGKTLLVKCLAKSLGLRFKRIQFTPDLMPADILGTEVLVEDRRSGTRELQFRPGPVFSNVLLADEVNRATPKTQSALLEAMGEEQVTLFGQKYSLELPFFVIATQNPIEMEGTYPLPEAQLDRFFFKLKTPFPDSSVLGEILELTTQNLAYEELPEPVLCTESLRANLAEQATLREELSVLKDSGPEDDRMRERQDRLDALATDAIAERSHRILHMRQTARGALPTQEARGFILGLIRALRQQQIDGRLIEYSPGPRAAQALLLAGKVRALLKEQATGYVLPEDIHPHLLPVLKHRLILNFEAQAQQQDAESILHSLIPG